MRPKVFEVSSNNPAAFQAVGKTLVFDESAVVAELERHEQELEKINQGQCKIETFVHIELSTYIPAIQSTIRTSLFITKENGKAILSFTRWTPDMSAVEEVREQLPNQTPVELGFPY